MNHYLQVLLFIRMCPQKFQSDYSRANARHVAEAASRGHITCTVNGINSGEWMVTDSGVNFMSMNGLQVRSASYA
ncbi:hypothetical protein [Chromobacterium haemolyticum]|uniref:hypothetical protein n=1 Tax=Chromobacterium haemolyticum TaxID=394935 RepID=UPI0009DAA948|nr:hypothetical protein [Chromobacterium haemolyticum]OQS44850.1 hypothetical protein B0T39_00970 [Chromobacterium haemolyticum]PTU68616.1 hypothetical protein DBB33_03740 [Chromobacterium haemolyticum]